MEAVVTQRIVTGAHYGLRDWLAQRITAVIMAVYTVIVLVVILGGVPITYAVWKDLFAQGWMRVATLLFMACLAWHAWVGMRNILMDYIKPEGLRLSLQVGILLVIASYMGWTIQILWR
jgi:succinate dehydrogenase / fumarate reductase, membrane anchor subunit